MTINDDYVKNVLLSVKELLDKKSVADFKDIIAMPKCKRYSVKEIGEVLEFLRRNGYIKETLNKSMYFKSKLPMC